MVAHIQLPVSHCKVQPIMYGRQEESLAAALYQAPHFSRPLFPGVLFRGGGAARGHTLLRL